MIDLLHPDHDELLKKWKSIVKETSHIWTWTSDLELSWLAEYATRCSNFLEIGSFRGRSAKVMLMANPSLKLTSLDTWDDAGIFEAYQHNLGPEIAAGRIYFVIGESQLVFSEASKNKEIGRFDGCFIDGGHLEHLVIADIKGVLPLMKPGSLMAGHDFRGDNDVAAGVRAVLGDNARNPTESIWCYQMP